MASPNPPHSLKALAVFRNLIYPELMRAVHVYRLEGGIEKEEEREYLFKYEGDYEEIGFCRVITLKGFCVSSQFEGMINGVWLCIYVFDSDRNSSPDLNCIPTLLSISRNPKLASVPRLACDLHTIHQLSSNAVSGVRSENSGLDLNSFPFSQSENEDFDHKKPAVERKKKRAASEDIAKLGLDDLAKYFDVPIIEASKHLNVGLTVLKRKCREFGIARWPHRKIKSLDGLIRDLQDEVERQRDDKRAAMVMAKRQKMIENEKENIERKPFMEIQRETKKFRQDIFKKKHIARARALEKYQSPITLSLF